MQNMHAYIVVGVITD